MGGGSVASPALLVSPRVLGCCYQHRSDELSTSLTFAIVGLIQMCGALGCDARHRDSEACYSWVRDALP
jgi:hypothetical protein